MKQPVSKTTKIVFPIVVVTIVASILAPIGRPVIGTVMLGNLMKESGVVERSEKRLGKRDCKHRDPSPWALHRRNDGSGQVLARGNLLVLALGFIAIGLDTAVGVLFGKLMCC